jgi:hypothetical protein
MHHISNSTEREAPKKKNNLDNLKAEEYTTLSTYKFSREALKNDEVPHNISNITQSVAHKKEAQIRQSAGRRIHNLEHITFS